METIDKQHILNRIDVGTKRINDLYTLIEKWLSTTNNYRLVKSKSVVLKDNLLQNYGISKIQLPAADIYKNNTLLASLKPKGLWVIGANLRIDLISRSKLVFLRDESKDQEKPKWKIIHDKNRQEITTLSEKNFLKVLNRINK